VQDLGVPFVYGRHRIAGIAVALVLALDYRFVVRVAEEAEY
jgi:hypothetical protein